MGPKAREALPAKEAALFRQIVRFYEMKQYKKGLKAADQILKCARRRRPHPRHAPPRSTPPAGPSPSLLRPRPPPRPLRRRRPSRRAGTPPAIPSDPALRGGARRLTPPPAPPRPLPVSALPLAQTAGSSPSTERRCR